MQESGHPLAFSLGGDFEVDIKGYPPCGMLPPD